MMNDACHEMHLLIQADLDGELTPAEAARVGTHMETCPDCAAVQAGMLQLSTRLRAEAPYHSAPETLRVAVRAFIEAETAPPPGHTPAGRAFWSWPRLRFGSGPSFGAGFALAACLALAIVLPRGDGGGLTDAVVADHIRSLQPGHLMDVVSTDQHTVKPWFDGRLTFAPPVKDLKTEGFPLAGGRLDYLDGREVAALVYHSRQHVIQLFVWPSDRGLNHRTAQGVRNGYNFVRWSQDEMAFWAVSDLNAAELADFVRLWRQS
jgi:anti-sigma factor RsiW